MNPIYDKLINCLDQIHKITDFQPEVGLVLGSGLGGFGEKIKISATVDYSSIDGFPVSTVAGHAGRFIFGHVGDVPVVAMQGRVHYYEGYKMTDVVLPVRLMCMLGAKKIILTNAAGGINTTFKPGTLMSLTDHITSFVPSLIIPAFSSICIPYIYAFPYSWVFANTIPLSPIRSDMREFDGYLRRTKHRCI